MLKVTNKISQRITPNDKNAPSLVCAMGSNAVLLTLPKQSDIKDYKCYCDYECDAIVLVGDTIWKPGTMVRKLNLENCYLYKGPLTIENE